MRGPISDLMGLQRGRLRMLSFYTHKAMLYILQEEESNHILFPIMQKMSSNIIL